MRNVIVGVSVIVFGVLLLARTIGLLHFSFVGLWPVILLVIGVAHLVERRVGTAVMLILLGTAGLACTYHWYGMTFGNAWPTLMIAAGIGMVVRAIVGDGPMRRRGVS